MIFRDVLYKGKVFCTLILDDEDADIAAKKWQVNLHLKSRTASKRYFRVLRNCLKADRDAGEKRHKLKIHQEVWQKHFGKIPDDLTVDHIDCNTMNNQKSNLRLLTVSENSKRKKKIRIK